MLTHPAQQIVGVERLCLTAIRLLDTQSNVAFELLKPGLVERLLPFQQTQSLINDFAGRAVLSGLYFTG